MTSKSRGFALAFAASLSMAGAASAQESVFEGVYVRGQAGYSIINVEVSAPGLGSADDDLDGFGGGAFVGFGGTSGILYGSVEAEIGYDGAEWSESSGGLTVDLEAALTYGPGLGSTASSLITFSSMAGLVGRELMSRPPSLSLVLVPHLVMRTLTASVLAAAWRGCLRITSASGASTPTRCMRNRLTPRVWIGTSTNTYSASAEPTISRIIPSD